MKNVLFRVTAVFLGFFLAYLILIIFSDFKRHARSRIYPPDRMNTALKYDSKLGWDSLESVEYLDSDSNGTKIAYLGDSFTQNAKWPRMVQSMTQNKGVQLAGYNLGVSGHGTVQTYLKLKRHIKEFQPELVVYLLYAWNDMRDSYQFPAIYYNPRMIHRPYYKKDGSGIEPIPLLYRLIRKIPLTEYSFIVNQFQSPDYVYYGDPDSWQPFYLADQTNMKPHVKGAWTATEHALVAMDDLVKKEGAQLIVLGIDNPFSVDHDVFEEHFPVNPQNYSVSRPLQILGEKLRAHNITYVNCLTPLRAEAEKLGKKIYNGPPGNLSGHFEPEGETVIAKLAVEEILKRLNE